MMKTCVVAFLLLVALLSIDVIDGSPHGVERHHRNTLEEDSLKIDERLIEGMPRTLQEAADHNETGHDEKEGHDENEGHDEDEDHDEDHHDGAKPWGAGLLAAFLVNLCTLIGVIAFVPASLFGRKAKVQTKAFVFHIMIPSFACGALLATTVFLLIPESLVLLSGGHEEHSEHEDEHRMLQEEEPNENEATWKFGISVLAGYFLPFIFSGFFPHSHIAEDNESVRAEAESAIPGEVLEEDKVCEEGGDIDVGSKDVEGDSKHSHRTDVDNDEQFANDTTPNYRLAASILAGDFFHNFADGVFIGSAFLLCDHSLAIIVTATTVFHELSQELADYFLLTNQCGFSTWKALAFNFVSGFSVMLGVIVVFATDVSDTSIGVILAMSAGVYFFVALTECAPRVNAYLTDTRRRATSFLFWILGAVPIGLVLLNHAHCE